MGTFHEFSECPVLADMAREADHVHVLRTVCRKSLREFLAATLSYMPGWMRFLYRVRWGFVRMLGARQEDVPRRHDMAPEDVSFVPGEPASFFTVVGGEENRYWLAQATDELITGSVGVVAQPLPGGETRFLLVTLVRFRRWTGRVYFAVITPFHHLVVNCMLREAAKPRARE